ncbi:MAG: family 10 glycosylhydrolase [Microcoleus sp. SU_5_3]|nr:family 10 glycosylhydrolase [Microcoleus sp. SU_5_3]
MVSSNIRFSDIQNHWAKQFIEGLTERGIISGFPDRTFRPDANLTRAQFATIVSKAFPGKDLRTYVPFVDVPASYWAAAAIQKAFTMRFISGYPDNIFKPENRITRAEGLVALISGIFAVNPAPSANIILANIYQDSTEIPNYAKSVIALATQAEIVVNHPNLNLLNPAGNATRADVAAWVYQALVYLKKAPKIASQYTVIPGKISLPTVQVSHRREFRAVWITSVWNIDWPFSNNLSVEQQKTELVKILDRLAEMNFNAIILQIRSEGDALYASELEPWSAWLTGSQGKPPQPYYDPLTFAISESHKRNIEVHAWLNPYRAKVANKNIANVSPHISVTNPECVYQWGEEQWMDPGITLVQDKTYSVILDVVKRYDIDGIHFDDYFYPYPIAGKEFPDSKVYNSYVSRGGKMSLGDWRRENVNKLVKRLAEGIRSTKPHVKFGISPFGIYRPGQPPASRGLDAYEQLYADAKKWLESGWVDYLTPQLYWRIDQTAQSYPMLLNWWLENNPQNKHIYPGNNLGRLDGNKWTVAEINKQIEITRNSMDKLALGNVFFSMKAFSDNRQQIYDNFKSTTYTQPALVPAMPWQKGNPPSSPTGVAVKKAGNSTVLNWKNSTDSSIRSWTLYQKTGISWKLIKIMNAATTEIVVASGTYALCAVNKMALESVGVFIEITG